MWRKGVGSGGREGVVRVGLGAGSWHGILMSGSGGGVGVRRLRARWRGRWVRRTMRRTAMKGSSRRCRRLVLDLKNISG